MTWLVGVWGVAAERTLEEDAAYRRVGRPPHSYLAADVWTQQHTMARLDYRIREGCSCPPLDSPPRIPAMKAAPRGDPTPSWAFAPAKAATVPHAAPRRGFRKAYSSACGDRSSAHASSPEVA